jgi:beta-lactamase superfamily II metal-dependent hydrolase
MRKWAIGILVAGLGLAPAVGRAAQAAPIAAVARGGPPPAGSYVIHAIDVGTGLAIFVEGHDFSLLYDAGSNDDFARGANNRVVAYLNAVRPDLKTVGIDHLVLSHPHKDHSELMPDVLTEYPVRNVWNSGALNPICSYRQLLANSAIETGLAYHDALGGPGTYSAAFKSQSCYGKTLAADTINVPRGPQMAAAGVALGAGAEMTILQRDGSKKSSFNENSVVVHLKLGSRSVLLPGDGEAGGRKPPTTAPNPKSTEGLLLTCCAAQLRSDILVAPHHGSKTSSRTVYLDAIGASQYVVSAGPTKYGSVTLPDAEVIAEYARRGTVWRTDLNDKTCATQAAKIGPDNDGRPGGCDNVRIVIGPDGTLTADYFRPTD